MFNIGGRDMDYKAIGQRIKQERNNMGLTQFQLAEKVDISPQYEGKIERGEKQFSFDTIAKLSIALNTSLDYLAFGHDNKNQCPERQELEILANKLSEGQLSLLNDMVRAMLVHKNRM